MIHYCLLLLLYSSFDSFNVQLCRVKFTFHKFSVNSSAEISAPMPWKSLRPAPNSPTSTTLSNYFSIKSSKKKAPLRRPFPIPFCPVWWLLCRNFPSFYRPLHIAPASRILPCGRGFLPRPASPPTCFKSVWTRADWTLPRPFSSCSTGRLRREWCGNRPVFCWTERGKPRTQSCRVRSPIRPIILFFCTIIQHYTNLP